MLVFPHQDSFGPSYPSLFLSLGAGAVPGAAPLYGRRAVGADLQLAPMRFWVQP